MDDYHFSKWISKMVTALHELKSNGRLFQGYNNMEDTIVPSWIKILNEYSSFFWLF